MELAKTPVTCAQLIAEFPDLILEIVGEKSQGFRKVASPEIGDKDSAVFANNARALKKALASGAKVIGIGKRDRALAESEKTNQTILICSNVELAMARTIKKFFLDTPYVNPSVSGVHATAIVSPTAEIAKNAKIGPNVFIGAKVKIAEGVFIGANAVIEDGSEIGAGTVIHPLAYIGHSSTIGQRCEILPHAVIGKEGFGYAHDPLGNHYRIPHSGRVILEDDVHVGSGCTLDRGTFEDTRIGSGTKIDNQCHFGHNTSIGKNSVITEGFSVAGSSKIGANFVSGGHAGVVGHLEICDGVQIAGLSGVTKTITKPGAYGGYPLQPLQEFLRTKAAIVNLTKMRKQLSKVVKHLGLDEEAPENGD
ncbi:MAG: UDP-3-O-(3-hydroxymyristoyl)glucosamine N-acyltransferase [Bdellovibrionota bacterium]